MVLFLIIFSIQKCDTVPKTTLKMAKRRATRFYGISVGLAVLNGAEIMIEGAARFINRPVRK